MQPKSIDICSVYKYTDYVQAISPTHTIFALNPAFCPPPKTSEMESRLLLSMHDVDIEQDQDYPPLISHITRIRVFLKSANSESKVLICCHAGLSRSVAIAYIIHCSFSSPEKYLDIAKVLSDLNPKASPNRLIVSLAILEGFIDDRAKLGLDVFYNIRV